MSKIFKIITSIFLSLFGLWEVICTLIDIPEKWKLLVTPIVSYVFNPEDCRPLLCFCSVIILILISYPDIKYYYLIFKRKIGIEENVTIQKLEKISSGASDKEKLHISKENKKENKTFIVFDADHFSSVNSHNITSISDGGVNHIGFNFTKSLKKYYTISVSGRENINYQAVEHTSNYARMIFPDGVRGIIRINFEE